MTAMKFIWVSLLFFLGAVIASAETSPHLSEGNLNSSQLEGPTLHIDFSSHQRATATLSIAHELLKSTSHIAEKVRVISVTGYSSKGDWNILPIVVRNLTRLEKV